MKKFSTLAEAINIANQLSKEQSKNIEIYKDRNSITDNFVFFTDNLDYTKHYSPVKFLFAYLCCGFITPFAIGYKLFKDNSPIVDQFETRVKMETALKAKTDLGYKPIRLNNDTEIRKFLGIN